MIEHVIDLLYLIAAILFIFGLKKLSSPTTARRGNLLAAIGMLIAILVTLLDKQIVSPAWIVAGMVIGAGIGLWWARAVPMTAMPQLVAAFNGFGGVASALVAISEHYRPDGGAAHIDVLVTIALSVLIGMVTFTGSFIAYAKLQGVMTGAPILYKGQHLVNILLGLAVVVFGVLFVMDPAALGWSLWLVLLVGGALGVLLTIPIGGADMPVVISLLNSYSGVAAAMTGFVLRNEALIISGSLVGSSGLILTNIMCKAMNRSLANVLFGGVGTADLAAGAGVKATAGTARQMSAEDAAVVMENARLIIVVPGYGMAVAQAQHVVREMADQLERRGVTVKYAIHPVAGRMPGHMNVLLAEANVPYPQLYDLDDINPEFPNCDVALVIGANDVTNPAARHDKASPIYGMPILDVDKARTVMVIKRSLNPGFAGVDNELYYLPNTYMLFGDAKKMITEVLSALKGG
ncbi:MAG TPA: NAD(P)(+) transhydrogenase (Re/Si-specific) subunit beta [Phycisphaerae bacterium]|nr:NAD(P)(+) transhydrogenase (Re/Si-specific) subunit beta [Phycisphaerae bacterium]HNU44067.1 NAD(P)(+) transhydrogenase (Re/Si-specific) subunit beta [Phycisphaerae bacterium]